MWPVYEYLTETTQERFTGNTHSAFITRVDVLRPTPLCARQTITIATRRQAGQGSINLRITSTPPQGRRKQSIKESFVVGVASLRAMIISIRLLDRDHTRKTSRKYAPCCAVHYKDIRPEAYSRCALVEV